MQYGSLNLSGTGPKQNILLFVCNFIASTICLRSCCPPFFIYSYHQMITHSLCEHLFDVISPKLWLHEAKCMICMCSPERVQREGKPSACHDLLTYVDMSLTCSCSDDQAVLCPLDPLGTSLHVGRRRMVCSICVTYLLHVKLMLNRERIMQCIANQARRTSPLHRKGVGMAAQCRCRQDF